MWPRLGTAWLFVESDWSTKTTSIAHTWQRIKNASFSQSPTDTTTIERGSNSCDLHLMLASVANTFGNFVACNIYLVTLFYVVCIVLYTNNFINPAPFPPTPNTISPPWPFVVFGLCDPLLCSLTIGACVHLLALCAQNCSFSGIVDTRKQSISSRTFIVYYVPREPSEGKAKYGPKKSEFYRRRLIGRRRRLWH